VYDRDLVSHRKTLFATDASAAEAIAAEIVKKEYPENAGWVVEFMSWRNPIPSSK
jgi:hypothetical protein